MEGPLGENIVVIVAHLHVEARRLESRLLVVLFALRHSSARGKKLPHAGCVPAFGFPPPPVD